MKYKSLVHLIYLFIYLFWLHLKKPNVEIWRLGNSEKSLENLKFCQLKKKKRQEKKKRLTSSPQEKGKRI
jgi:hypothetical protein